MGCQPARGEGGPALFSLTVKLTASRTYVCALYESIDRKFKSGQSWVLLLEPGPCLLLGVSARRGNLGASCKVLLPHLGAGVTSPGGKNA